MDRKGCEMKILHVITGMQKAAGTSVFCGEVCNGVSARGYDVSLATVVPYDPAKDYAIDGKVRKITIDSLFQGNDKYDIIHIHALWMPVLHKVSNWAHKNKIPVVWSPHGMLTPWAFRYKWWKKFPVWWLYQKSDLQKAELLHATAQCEVEDVRRMALKNKVVVAPLGVNLYSLPQKRRGAEKILLFVSRVQRKKGLPNLIKAWSSLQRQTSSWRIRIVGPDQDNHTAELKQMCVELGVDKDFDFVGPKYGDELVWEYSSADLFALPTHSENFGSVVIEALAQGVPVITTKGTPWQELEERKCGWWVDIGVEPLREALERAMALSDVERRAMGERGRKLVEEKYTWDAVVEKMLEGYRKISPR